MNEHKSLKRRIGEVYIKYKIRVGRGQTFLAEIDGVINAFQKGGIILLLISTYFNYLLPLYLLPLFWILQKIIEYFLGWLDQKHLGWWRFETRYMQENENINPFQAELMSRIKNIEDKLK